MGTNYYWQREKCEHCGRSNEFHLGKKSAGWKFSIHGDRDADLDSWAAIKAALLASGSGPIVNEYGDVVPVDTFVRLVEDSWADAKLRAATDLPYDYQDSDGYWLSDAEFS